MNTRKLLLAMSILLVGLGLGAYTGAFETGLTLSDLLRIARISLAATAMNVLYVVLSSLIKMRRVSHPPGWGLRRFAEFCFANKTFTQVLEPALSDMQKEHFEALHAGHPWKARMVLMRGYWSFWSAVVAQLPISFVRRVYEVWKATKTGS